MARNQKQQREASEFEERVVYINRVSKTVKGGRRMSLVALVVVGDGKGTIGYGIGKSGEERPVQVPRYRQRPQHHQGCRRGPQGALQP